MKRIYQAANNIEAHMIVHLLGQTGIHGHVNGEHLQSGAGELPLGNLVAVSVADEDVAAARAVIHEWEARTSPADASQPAPGKTSSQLPVLTFFIGALLSGGIVWSVYNGPERTDSVDYNEDGKSDERLFYNGNRLERIETDRNFDGRVDAVQEYGRDGQARTYRSDDDFDGRLESTTVYRRGQPDELRIDGDGDGRIDYRARFRYGVLDTYEYLSPSGSVAKKIAYRRFKMEHAQLDLDGDGLWERSYRYDRYDEPVEERDER